MQSVNLVSNKWLSQEISPEVPLCVDLDGTLVFTDTLYESLLAVLRRQPWLLALIPFWLARGRAYLKSELAHRALLDASLLPYNLDLIAWLEKHKQNGRDLVLVTAANQSVAESVNKVTGLFTEVLGSDDRSNLKGKQKANVLRQRFPAGFDYVGDCKADYPVWQTCRKAFLVSRKSSIAGKHAQVRFEQVFHIPQRNRLRTWLRALRVHQWVKNLLVFAPIISGHRLTTTPVLFRGVLLFVAFGFCASSVYVINDLVDISSDRKHRTKRNRPFANGQLSIPSGVVALILLFSASMLIAHALSPATAWVLLVYFAVSQLYSLFLKSRLILDVFTLLLLYSLRILAGGVTTGIALSPWLLAFVNFALLSLAFAKRAVELQYAGTASHAAATPGRDYRPSDLGQVTGFGQVSGYVAGLVLALYIGDGQASREYLSPAILWFLVPIFLYWITRCWVFCGRGIMHEDPIMFSVKDKVTYVTAALCAVGLYVPHHFHISFPTVLLR